MDADPLPIIRRHINVQDSRDVRALEILETSPYWKEVKHSRHDGQKAYEIASSSRVDKNYHVTMRDCECEDHVYRAQICSHIRAVRLYVNIVHSYVNRAYRGHLREIKAQKPERELTIF